MATFFGGEQLSELVLVKTTGNMNQLSRSLIYTVPTGFYAIVEFAHCSFNNSNYYISNSFGLNAVDTDDLNTAYDTGLNIAESQTFYEKFGTRLNLFFNSGTKFYRLNEFIGTADIKAELHLRLYKKP